MTVLNKRLNNITGILNLENFAKDTGKSAIFYNLIFSVVF